MAESNPGQANARPCPWQPFCCKYSRRSTGYSSKRGLPAEWPHSVPAGDILPANESNQRTCFAVVATSEATQTRRLFAANRTVQRIRLCLYPRDHMSLWPAIASRTFNSLCRVLFTVRSLYLCTIGPVTVFSLWEDTPPFRAAVPRCSTHGCKQPVNSCRV